MVQKFGRKKWCKIRPENCCKDWPKVVAKVGQKLQKSAEKCCKGWPKNCCKAWSKKLRNSAEKNVWTKNCCKRKQMQSMSAMNSQSSINWVQLQNSNLNLLKHAKLQPLVGMPRQSGPRCAPGKQNSNLSVDWDHVVWSIGVLSL